MTESLIRSGELSYLDFLTVVQTPVGLHCLASAQLQLDSRVGCMCKIT